MFLKDKYGKKWKLQAAKVLRTGALVCVSWCRVQALWALWENLELIWAGWG